MVKVLMMSAKLATPSLLKIKIFRNKGYKFIIPDYYVTNKTLSCDWNYIVDELIWPKFGNCSICMREVIIITSILWAFDQKNPFFKGWSWFKLNNFGLALGMTLKFNASQNVLGAKSCACKSYREKTLKGRVGAGFYSDCVLIKVEWW